MPHTNCLCEFQIAQEYTGQQIDLCYLVPMWKECLDFDTYHGGEGSLVSKNVLGAAGVSNVGSDLCWTGNPLAGANLYGYGRLIFDPELSAEQIAEEWVRAAVTTDNETADIICRMLLSSRDIYESYTSPLGVRVFPLGNLSLLRQKRYGRRQDKSHGNGIYSTICST